LTRLQIKSCETWVSSEAALILPDEASGAR